MIMILLCKEWIVIACTSELFDVLKNTIGTTFIIHVLGNTILFDRVPVGNVLLPRSTALQKIYYSDVKSRVVIE